MKEIKDYVRELTQYNGRPVKIMEVCGSHTAAIAKSGIRSLLSDRISLVSGPGCPVCVTPSSYIDKLISLSEQENTCIVTFGDLLRVPGSRKSLNRAKGEGADIRMVYSPADMIELAKESPQKNFVFAAVGFETTTPVYALLLETLCNENITNVKLLTSLKTMPEAVEWLCRNDCGIDGFLAPGHVCAITGSEAFENVAETYHIPFAVAGFDAKELILAIYGLIRMIETGDNTVKNFYPSVVAKEGNITAQAKMDFYFRKTDAVWRGMGMIADSGRILKQEFSDYDAGSDGLQEDIKLNEACCCSQILMGKMEPKDCPLFRTVCNPQNPQGACMVSEEGSCCQYYLNT